MKRLTIVWATVVMAVTSPLWAVSRADAAQAQAAVTQADIQRLQDAVYDAGGDVSRLRDRDARLADSLQHIVPGHDPLVMKLYPAPSPELEGIAVRLDVPPSGAAPVRADYLSGR